MARARPHRSSRILGFCAISSVAHALHSPRPSGDARTVRTPAHAQQTVMKEGDSMVYRRVAVTVAAVLVTSASAHAWDPTVVGFVDSNTDASPAATVTDDTPARIAHASAAEFGPEMVGEATIADD